MKVTLSFILLIVLTFGTLSAQDKSETILKAAYEAHGGDLYETAKYSFVFRKNNYTFDNTNGHTYTSTNNKNGKTIYDVLQNGNFSRTVAGNQTALSAKQTLAYSSELNSVIYFATLPHKLFDKAVNKNYKGQTTIKGKTYDVLQVTFEQEGGGKDHDDQFHYWINTDTKRIDYIAYNYKVNKGGVRFRSAYNTRIVGGILFQDYVNYLAPVGTPLKDLPSLYEKGSLKELSRIETEKVVQLK